MSRHNTKRIKIALWNANGIRTKTDELTYFLQKHQVDICLLNETKLTKSIKFNIRNYTTYRQDRDQCGGGVAILIKHNIPNIRLTQDKDHVLIKLWNGVIIAGCYNPPRRTWLPDQLDKIFNLANKVLAGGDFNAIHSAWQNEADNPSGFALLDYTMTNNLQTMWH